MRILWFTNSPSLSTKRNNEKTTSGGWIEALESALKDKDLQLGVVFYADNEVDDFAFNKTHYFPIKRRGSNKLKRFVERVFNAIEPSSDLYKYLEIIHKFKPDIIHIHGTENPFGLIISEIDIPIVISIQGIVSVIQYKYFQGIDRKIVTNRHFFIDRILFSSPVNSFKKAYKMHLREVKVLHDSKFIIGRTEWDKRVTSILAPKSKYFHNDEILRDQFYKNTWAKNRNSKIVIFSTSGPQFYKGIETIIATANLLSNENIDFLWNVAGLESNNILLRYIQVKLGKIDTNQNIKFLGRISEDRLIENLLESDMYVMPSHIENSPNSLCEAMMLGIPCIATFAGGTSSLLKDREEGILIQDGDPWSMAGSIIELRSDSEKARKMGLNARKVSLRRHNKQKIVDDLLNIYLEISQSFT